MRPESAVVAEFWPTQDGPYMCRMLRRNGDDPIVSFPFKPESGSRYLIEEFAPGRWRLSTPGEPEAA